jgi:hypothetical protein
LAEEELNNENQEQPAAEEDELEVFDEPAEAEDPLEIASSEDIDQPTASSSRWMQSRQGLGALFKDRAFWVSATVGLVVGAVILFLVFPGPPPPESESARANGKIVYRISSPIGWGHYAEMKVSIPFKDTNEKKDLINRLASVKPKLPTATRLPEVAASIKERDLPALQNYVANIVSTATGVPAKDLGVEIQSLQ